MDSQPAILQGEGIPIPPFDAAMPAVPQTVLNLAMLLLLVAAVVFLLVNWGRDREVWLPGIFLMLGAFLIPLLWDPVLCHLGLLYYPEQGQWSLVELMDRKIPTFMLFGWGLWLVGIYLTMLYLERFRKAWLVWLLFVAALLFDLILEEICLHAGLYHYYGNHGPRVISLPLWWLFMNGALLVVPAYGMILVRPHFQGIRTVLWIPFGLVIIVVVSAGLAFPSWVAINSPDKGITLPCVLCTIALALLSVDWVAEEIASGRPRA
jgi:hypothetical protein